MIEFLSVYSFCQSFFIAGGDNLNDLDMIRKFRSYAMANGDEKVRLLEISI